MFIVLLNYKQYFITEIRFNVTLHKCYDSRVIQTEKWDAGRNFLSSVDNNSSFRRFLPVQVEFPLSQITQANVQTNSLNLIRLLSDLFCSINENWLKIRFGNDNNNSNNINWLLKSRSCKKLTFLKKSSLKKMSHDDK